YKDAQIKSSRIWSRYFPMMEMWGNLTIVILLGFGGFLVVDQHLSLGTLVALFSLARFMIGRLPGLGLPLNQVMRSLTASARIFGVIDLNEDIQNPEHPEPLRNVKGDIRLENVNFRYREGDNLLDNIDIDAPSGST